MFKTRVLSTVALLAALSLLATACDGDDTQRAGPSATVSLAPTETPTIEPSVTESPLPGLDDTATPAFEPEDEVLTVAVQEAATLDPMRIEDPAAVLIARQLFEGLTRWDPVRERVEGAAARSWEVSDKGRLFTFELRPDMTFHDGTPVTARDFKFAFDRIAEKVNASNIAYTLERIEGFEETNQLGDADALSGVKARDDDTLEIRLTEPFYEFPLVLTHPGLVPLPADVVRDVDEFLAHPVGNGPFEMTNDWSPGDTLELRAYPDFYEAADLDGLRFVAYDDAAASWVPFVTGQLDIAEIPADRIDVAIERYGDEGVLPLLAGYYYGFNVRSKNLKDEDLRTSISRAIDRRAIARSIYKGTLVAPRGIVPEGMPGFGDDACRKICTYSKSAARSELKEVPKDARTVTIGYTEGQPHRKIAQAVAGDLEDIGIEVKVKAYEFPAYLRQLRAGSQEMYRYGWLAEYPSPSVFLTSLFRSTSPDNHADYSNEKVDKLLEQAAAERDDAKRQRIYVKAEKLILKDLPLAPIGSFVTHWAAGDRVGEITWDTMGGFDAVDISLAEDG
jgi:oligopeptide transport system substrate-binding protein